jgi:hypothetical protein
MQLDLKMDYGCYHSDKKVVPESAVIELVDVIPLLAKKFKYVRVDFIYNENHVYFSQLQFYPKFGCYTTPYNDTLGVMMGNIT